MMKRSLTFVFVSVLFFFVFSYIFAENDDKGPESRGLRKRLTESERKAMIAEEKEILRMVEALDKKIQAFRKKYGRFPKLPMKRGGDRRDRRNNDGRKFDGKGDGDKRDGRDRRDRRDRKRDEKEDDENRGGYPDVNDIP